MNPEAERIQARLRQIDEYRSKGLMRAEEAEAARAELLKRLMHVLVPDSPAPRLPWRAHLGAFAAMLVLVGSVSAYLLSGHAGLRRRSEEMLAQGRIAATQDAAMRRDRLARIAAGESLAPDRFGRFGRSATPIGAASGANGNADAIAPLLSGHIELDPALASRVVSDDALFVVVRLPNDPDGLPLAAMRVEVSNLPFDFDIGTRELLGSPARFLHAASVVVTARISRSGTGLARPGDLLGTSEPVAPWNGHVRISIDRVVPKS